MDLCLLNPENLNIEQTRLFHVSTFLVVDWVLKNLSYSCMMWFESSLSIHVADLCQTNQSSKFCRSTLLIGVCQIKFFNTKQFPYCSIAFSWKEIGKLMCYKILSDKNTHLSYRLEWNPDTIRRMRLVAKPSLRGCWARRACWKLTGTTVRA